MIIPSHFITLSSFSFHAKQSFCGIIYEDENDSDGMKNILEELHKYVPYIDHGEDKVFQEQGVVGDQLTVERGVNGLMEISNGFTAEERREGIHFEVADFHAHIKLLQVNHLFKIHTQS